jgi:hypothetical protein
MANRLMGKRTPGEVRYEESEQADARRRFLHVEKVAKKQQASDAQAQAERIKSATNQLHRDVVTQLSSQLDNGHSVVSSVLSLNQDISPLLDTLSTRACTVTKLEPLVAALPWLQEDLIRTANAPEHRRVDTQGKIVVIESSRTALSLMGIGNLRFLLPALILRHAMPQITDPYPNIKTRLFEFYLALANAAACLAKLRGLNEYNAYVLALFSGLGPAATVRRYFRLYYQSHREALETAAKDRNVQEHDALQFVQPDVDHIARTQKKYANLVVTRVLESLVFQRIAMQEPWKDKSHPLREVIDLAAKFAFLKMLTRYRLVEKQEAQEFLVASSLSREDIDELNHLALFEINVNQSCD